MILEGSRERQGILKYLYTTNELKISRIRFYSRSISKHYKYFIITNSRLGENSFIGIFLARSCKTVNREARSHGDSALMKVLS